MNTQTQEALKMAIGLLEDDLMDLVYEQDTEFKSKYAGGYKPERLKYAAELIVRGKEAIQACKEALAQPAQEPVAWMSKKRGDVSKAKMYFNEGEEILPLYTHPAPSWQGLSDDDIEVIDADCWVYPIDSPELFNHYKFARAIEQALKEKNEK